MSDDIKRYCPATDPPALCKRGCGMGACKRTSTAPFWDSVRELAAMREHIPPERRALSGVRRLLAADTKEKWRDE